MRSGYTMQDIELMGKKNAVTGNILLPPTECYMLKWHAANGIYAKAEISKEIQNFTNSLSVASRRTWSFDRKDILTDKVTKLNNKMLNGTSTEGMIEAREWIDIYACFEPVIELIFKKNKREPLN